MRLGAVIPCYKPHLPKLLRLLESIEGQTRRPDCVVVACSSVTAAEVGAAVGAAGASGAVDCWVLSPARRNAAENRNAGLLVALGLGVDAISFIDADDVMHPQRCEALIAALEGGGEGGSDVVLHDYWDGADLERPFASYSDFGVEYDCLARAPSGCAVHRGDWRRRVHHSQVTVSRRVLDAGQRFPEGAEYERREDAVFCGNVLGTGGFRSAYIPRPLSKYDAAGSWV
jgi:glycosyltransferase involved in cell wall biosynthesis